MGPQAAINAVFYNQLQAIEDPDERATKTEELRAEYAEDIDILHLASELVVDAVIQPEDLRAELIRRYALPRRQAPRVAGEAQPDHAGVAAPGAAMRPATSTLKSDVAKGRAGDDRDRAGSSRSRAGGRLRWASERPAVRRQPAAQRDQRAVGPGQPGGGFDRGISVDRAWTLTTGAGATIADIDVGCSSTSPISQVQSSPDGDFYAYDSDPTSDTREHPRDKRRRRARRAADNGVGIAGIAPDARLMPLRTSTTSSIRGRGWPRRSSTPPTTAPRRSR